ncbi:MAG: hypothetical protein JWM99_2643, partial [Verrucomicrobiales bacterium]|nr:hypothetical protein [Verrucomicrobiales bacterium]
CFDLKKSRNDWRISELVIIKAVAWAAAKPETIRDNSVAGKPENNGGVGSNQFQSQKNPIGVAKTVLYRKHSFFESFRISKLQWNQQRISH